MENQKSPWNINISDFFLIKIPEEKILFLLKFGILAPSTHNSQPWLFKVESNICEIYSNPAIAIKEADPSGRDLYISLGCLIENIYIAAAYYNIVCKISYLLDLDTNLVARLRFDNLDNTMEQILYKNLIRAIIKRQTVRGIFRNRVIDPKILKSIKSNNKEVILNTIIDSRMIEKLSDLTAKGLRLAYQNRSFRKEMATWFRTNLSTKKEGLPGYALNMSTPLSLIFPNLVRYFNIGTLVSKINYKSMSSAKMVCVFSSKLDDKKSWLEIGREAERVMLLLTSKNIKTSIFVAAVEIGELYLKVQEILKIKTRPQFILCAGYMDSDQKHTARYQVKEKIIY